MPGGKRPGAGRPKGHRLSKQSKEKISRSLRRGWQNWRHAEDTAARGQGPKPPRYGGRPPGAQVDRKGPIPPASKTEKCQVHAAERLGLSVQTEASLRRPIFRVHLPNGEIRVEYWTEEGQEREDTAPCPKKSKNP